MALTPTETTCDPTELPTPPAGGPDAGSDSEPKGSQQCMSTKATEDKAQALEHAMEHLALAFTHMAAATIPVQRVKDYYKLNQLCKISGDVATLLHVVQADIQIMSNTAEF